MYIFTRNGIHEKLAAVDCIQVFRIEIIITILNPIEKIL